METTKKETRGGARTGAGRPRKEPTQVLGVRVPLSLHSDCKDLVKNYVKNIADEWEPLTVKALLQLGFKINDAHVEESRVWFRYELGTCTLYVKLSGRVTLDADYLTEETLLLEGASLNQIKNLLKAFSL